MLINCTNHPYEIWNDAQRKAVGAYGPVVDLPFPHIEPDCTPADLRNLTADYAERIR